MPKRIITIITFLLLAGSNCATIKNNTMAKEKAILLLQDCSKKYNWGSYEEALLSCDHSVSFDSKNADSHLLRGMVLLSMGRNLEAQKDFSQAIQLSPENWSAYFESGAANYRLGNLDAALSDLNRTIELHPTFLKSYYVRGTILADLKKYRDAISDFSHALKADPNWSEVLVARGSAYLESGKLVLAVVDLDRVLKLHPAGSEALYSRGLLQIAESGNSQVACSDFSEAKRSGSILAEKAYKKYCDSSRHASLSDLNSYWN